MQIPYITVAAVRCGQWQGISVVHANGRDSIRVVCSGANADIYCTVRTFPANGRAIAPLPSRDSAKEFSVLVSRLARRTIFAALTFALAGRAWAAAPSESLLPATTK